jgi:hypothetical protein
MQTGYVSATANIYGKFHTKFSNTAFIPHKHWFPGLNLEQAGSTPYPEDTQGKIFKHDASLHTTWPENITSKNFQLLFLLTYAFWVPVDHLQFLVNAVKHCSPLLIFCYNSDIHLKLELLSMKHW